MNVQTRLWWARCDGGDDFGGEGVTLTLTTGL
jgi:hypothetical protein